MKNFILTIIVFSPLIIMCSIAGMQIGRIAAKAAAIPEKDIEQIRDIPNQEFYTEFDIVYVESADTGWEVSTEQYGTIFVETTYAEAITFASVLTYIGYSCDYSCEEEMLNAAINEFNQVMYHD